MGGLGEGEGVIRLDDPQKDKVEVPLVPPPDEIEVTPHVACNSLRGILPAWMSRMPFCNFLM